MTIELPLAKTLLRTFRAGRYNRNKPAACRSHKYRILGRRMARAVNSNPVKFLAVMGAAGVMAVAAPVLKARRLSAEAGAVGAPGDLDVATRRRIVEELKEHTCPS